MRRRSSKTKKIVISKEASGGRAEGQGFDDLGG